MPKLFSRVYKRKKTSLAERLARAAYKDKIKLASFLEGYYYDDPLLPFVYFYKFLSLRRKNKG